MVFQVVLGTLDINRRWRVFCLSWKQKSPRRQPARAGCDSPSTQRRDWQRHVPHKGSQTLYCTLSSPMEPPGRRAWLFILAHSKLNIFIFKRKRGNFITSPVSQHLHLECVSHQQHQQCISCSEGKEQHWEENGKFTTPDQVRNTGEKHPCKTVRSTLEKNLSCFTNLFPDCFRLQKKPVTTTKKSSSPLSLMEFWEISFAPTFLELL